MDQPHTPSRRRRAAKRRSPGQTLLLLLAANIIPLGIVAYLALEVRRGNLKFDQERIPAEFVPNLVALGVVLLALIFVASWSLPVAHQACRSLLDIRRRRRAVPARGLGGWSLRVLSGPFLGLAYGFAWMVRAILTVLALTLIALFLFFLVRLKWHGFGQEAVDQAQAWVQGLGG